MYYYFHFKYYLKELSSLNELYEMIFDAYSK